MPQLIAYQRVMGGIMGHESAPAFKDSGNFLLWLSGVRASIFKRLLVALIFILGSAYFWYIRFQGHGSSLLAHTRNGMPYATPPLGNLRFRPPQPLDKAWKGVRNATSYSPMCKGYGGHTGFYPHSEDCLTINVVIPSNSRHRTLLPVLVFIYGGGPNGGSSSNSHYNMTFLVDQGARCSMPFIGVSFNYRSSIWGFISSQEALGTRNLNIGLHDQRLALHWVQENIAAFGGDATKVTIMGGSSGATSVGLHLLAYGGRDDELFRAAILQSGNSMPLLTGVLPSSDASYERLITSTSCKDAVDSLECLRHLPVEEFDRKFSNAGPSIVTADMSSQSFPVIDGDFIQNYGSISLKESKVVKVPIMTGVTSNEGFEFISHDWQTWADAESHILNSYPLNVAEKLLSLYPADAVTEHLTPPIRGITDRATYNRIEKLFGDLQYNAAKRLQCGVYSQLSTCYSFRFDALGETRTGNPFEGVLHGAEIAPIFQTLGDSDWNNTRETWTNSSPGYLEMSRVMGLMWAGFVVHLDPNAAFSGVPWPKYSLDDPRNIVFNVTGPYWTEADTYRQDATKYINEIRQGVFSS